MLKEVETDEGQVNVELEDVDENPSNVSATAADLDIRIIYPNSLSGNSTTKFLNNTVRTSKYRIYSFLPLFLFEQFMRLANVYFLVIIGLQQIPNISPTGRWTTLVPSLSS